jgi:hypothetical protein
VILDYLQCLIDLVLCEGLWGVRMVCMLFLFASAPTFLYDQTTG